MFKYIPILLLPPLSHWRQIYKLMFTSFACLFVCKTLCVTSSSCLATHWLGSREGHTWHVLRRFVCPRPFTISLSHFCHHSPKSFDFLILPKQQLEVNSAAFPTNENAATLLGQCLLHPNWLLVPLIDTTRKPEANERNGEHYYFVQEEEMAVDIVSREFLEYGQRKNILFGIRLDSVRAVIATGRMPVLDVEPRALRILRSAEFAPLVVLLVPPPLSRLLSQDGQHDMLVSDKWISPQRWHSFPLKLETFRFVQFRDNLWLLLHHSSTKFSAFSCSSLSSTLAYFDLSFIFLFNSLFAHSLGSCFIYNFV